MSDEMKHLLIATTAKRHRRDTRSPIFGSRRGILIIGLGFLVVVSASALAVAIVGSMKSTEDRRKPVVSQPTNTETKHADNSKKPELSHKLTEEQHFVTREKGTERPYSGKYWNYKEKGTYLCVCCGTPLFESRYKFDSGTGWPSFDRPIDEKSVKTAIDLSLLQTRTEVMCRKCDAHLGHVYDDGLTSTRLRYSINSVALDFQKASKDDETAAH